MRGIILFFRKSMFKLLVLISLCIIIYYAAGNKIFNWLSFASSNFYKNSTISRDNKGEGNNNVTIFMGKPLPVNRLDSQDKIDLSTIKNVKIAELKNGEQTIIMEDNPQKPGIDVILAARGIRARWIFRFKDGKACNGKISIERFGLIIPVVEKEMTISFAPLNDFTIICDKGKFNYYIKVMDNLNSVLNSGSTQRKSTQTENAAASAKPSTKASSVISGTTKQSTANSSAPVKQKEKEIKTSNQPAKPIESLRQSASSNNNSGGEQESAAANKDAAGLKEEPKKPGLLDHIFHHNH